MLESRRADLMFWDMRGADAAGERQQEEGKGKGGFHPGVYCIREDQHSAYLNTAPDACLRARDTLSRYVM